MKKIPYWLHNCPVIAWSLFLLDKSIIKYSANKMHRALSRYQKNCYYVFITERNKKVLKYISHTFRKMDRMIAILKLICNGINYYLTCSMFTVFMFLQKQKY